MIDKNTAIYLAEGVLTDNSPVYAIKLLKRQNKDPNSIRMGEKIFDILLHVTDYESASSLIDLIADKVIEIESII